MSLAGAAYSALIVLTIILGALMLAYTWRRRLVPGGRPLVSILVLLIGWAAALLGEIVSPPIESKLLYFNLRQIGQVTLPVLWLVLTVEVYRQDFWRNRWLLAALFGVPAVTMILAFSNQPLLRESIGLGSRFGLTIIAAQRGPWTTLGTAYNYTLTMIGIVLLMDLLRRTVPGQRQQTFILIAGIIPMVLANLLDLMELNPVAPLSPTVFVFVPMGLALMWGLFRQRLIDVMPVAHDRVLEAIADGVLVINRAGLIVDLNRAARDIFSRTLPNQGQLLGKSLTEVLRDWPEWQAESPEPRAKFEVGFAADSTRLIYRVDVTTLNTPTGDLMGQIMLINDITAEKQGQELQAERERILVLQRFIRDASHDLRTPMSVIQSSAYLMKRLADKQIGDLATLHPKLPQVYAAVIEGAIDVTGKLRDRAVAADDAAKRLWSILSGMIELAELEAASVIEKHLMDFNLIVEAVIKGRSAEAERHGLLLEHSLADAIPPIHADEKRLSRAIDAVVSNAIQFTPQGGKIMVKTVMLDGSVCVEVVDSGIGIAPDDLPRVYDRFFRSDPARGTDTGGAGLGLSLAKAIIEAHGGSITAESELGVGSSFKLSIPAGK